jgi:hypothetical protein
MRGRARTVGLGVLATSVLVGCIEVPPEFAAIGNMIGPPGPRFADGTPAHGGIPAEPPPTVTSNEITQRAVPPAPAPRATVASIAPALARPALKDVRELIGLGPTELQARLGDPALRRRDAPAEIWQYRSALCVLDLFLYREGPATRVTNAELRPRDGREIPAATCLSSL